MFYYQIVFNDGRMIRREGVTKRVAEAAFITMTEEMILFNVASVAWGKI